ncbi:HAD family phosphatase [Quadrisphaera sp. DSM 44207]|uniref:HAD family hydrolase n=1 Tax=Quadrisphaera sp. DSM 44207 TaxID=1881057 RepID=UPI00088E1451|nr:HAD family phosphatase [Quadrisphaera sp. DSM 44207]SDQ40797.1 haloacid dehalogenase superfamily, subfamily IA, variant 3 with third motif having DD or ED [Quadrisphaera sp. DSM 44207]
MSSTPAAPPGPPAAVLWDMDGTLVDTEPSWVEAEFALVREHGRSWSLELARSLVGSDLRVSAGVLQREGGVRLGTEEIVQGLTERVLAAVRERVSWRPGALELLTAVLAGGVPCALVTMSWSSLAHEVVRRAPEGAFAAVVTGDTAARPKPAPDPYLQAARALGVDPGACVALEDSRTGVASALAAGVPTVGVPHVVPLDPAPGLVRVPTLRGLDLPWLARVAAGDAEDALTGAGGAAGVSGS